MKKPPLAKKRSITDVSRKKVKLVAYRYRDYCKTMLIALMQSSGQVVYHQNKLKKAHAAAGVADSA